MWYNTKAAHLLGIQYPILQGPFGGGLSSVALVAAVSNMGGLGGYGAYTMRPAEIYEIDKQIRAATDQPYNLNLWVSDKDNSEVSYEKMQEHFKPYFDELGIAFPPPPAPFQSRFENQLQVVLDIRPSVFSFVFGLLPAAVIDDCHKRGIRLIGTATTLDEAIALEANGVDLIVASGFEAGGHRPSFLEQAELSTTGTFVLVQLIKEKVKIPVIAAGGIANGRGIAAARTLGADGVQIGTAFLATEESGALPAHREALFAADAKYTMLSRAFTGRLGRGLTTRLARETMGKEGSILPFPLQSTLISTLRKAALAQQKYDLVMFWGGQIAPLLKHRNVSSLMQSLIADCSHILH